MAIRFLIGDTQGKEIGEVEPAIGPISWRVNQVGRVQFQMGITDAKTTEQYLIFGNRILIQFDNGLPDWGGMIDPPREWSSRIVQATAYSGEYILGLRTTDQGRYFSGDPVGEIYRKLIEETNLLAPTGIEIGSIWAGGDGHFPDYHMDNLLKIIQESVCGRLSTAEFEVAGGLSGGRITFTANFYERMGKNKPEVALVEDRNVVEAKVSEQGPIVNYWNLAGSGQGWADDRLMTLGVEDKASQAKYGLRMDAAVFNDVNNQDTLDGHAADLLAEFKEPNVVFDLTVSDAAPGRFADYGLGDGVWLDLPSYGFEGIGQMVRVMGREYNPSTGFCRLVVEG